MKKFLSLSLAAAMIVSLAACQSGGNTEGETQAAGNGVENVTVEGAETYKIGVIGPLTGDSASYGISVQNGAEIAAMEINKAGGIKAGDKTYQVEIIAADDEAKPDKAITAYNTLMDEGMQALVGATTSDACIAVTDPAKEDGILMVTPSGSAEKCTQYDNCFRVCFTDPLQGETMADYIVNTLGYKNVAVLYNNSDTYSTGIKDAFVAKLTELGGTITAEEAFVEGDVDFGSQLTNIKASNPEVIFVPAYYQAVTYITKQAKDKGIDVPFTGSDGWDGVLNTVSDPSTVEGAIFLSPFFAGSEDEMVKNFVSEYEAAYGSTPDQFAADSYDAVYIVKAAIEQAGSIDNAAMIAAMTEIEVDGLTGENISFTADGEPNKGAKFIQIVDGEYTEIK